MPLDSEDIHGVRDPLDLLPAKPQKLKLGGDLRTQAEDTVPAPLAKQANKEGEEDQTGKGSACRGYRQQSSLPSLGEVGAPCVGIAEQRLEGNHCGSGFGCCQTQETQGKAGL